MNAKSGAKKWAKKIPKSTERSGSRGVKAKQGQRVRPLAALAWGANNRTEATSREKPASPKDMVTNQARSAGDNQKLQKRADRRERKKKFRIHKSAESKKKEKEQWKQSQPETRNIRRVGGRHKKGHAKAGGGAHNRPEPTVTARTCHKCTKQSERRGQENRQQERTKAKKQKRTTCEKDRKTPRQPTCGTKTGRWCLTPKKKFEGSQTARGNSDQHMRAGKHPRRCW